MASASASDIVIKLDDIARHMGISTSTVSRALSGKQNVDPTLAAKIVEAAESLGYPLERYRALTIKSRLLGVVVPNIASPFFAHLIEDIERAAAVHKFNVLLCNSDYSQDTERACLEILAEKQVAGILIAPVATGSDLPQLIVERRIPVVQVDRHADAFNCDLVQSDGYHGAYEAVQFLVQQGYQRIAVISGPRTHSTGSDRLSGYLAALRDANFEATSAFIEVVGFLEQDGYIATLRLLALNPRPEVIFVSNVDMTIGAIQAIHECCLRVPNDVGIIGFDEFPFARILAPPLTTVEQPIEMLAFTAVDLLVRRISNRVSSDPVRVRLAPKLNVRGSTKLRTATVSVELGSAEF